MGSLHVSMIRHRCKNDYKTSGEAGPAGRRTRQLPRDAGRDVEIVSLTTGSLVVGMVVHALMDLRLLVSRTGHATAVRGAGAAPDDVAWPS